ncbi:DNA polymerase III subunit beta [Acidithiobacillus ferrivorans]|uniref:DNA polymerase III subunit beta n=1 Tax=Acidithiobacillus ferrivorans TaxID=160808 RepID=UPI000893D129|nr:DNA polymerase III subunit beta [Acidithiobacillus ferrivorans]MBU2849510.1 DNA polymerase III subunit beta [Acidithiobacillus ferrivorans]OFA17267.1 DNA polymerase III subunit beta [Acidithiobacillus ferrivorans]
MKITIDREDLLPILANMANIADRRPVQPILAHVLIEAAGQHCRFVATDLEVQLSADLDHPVDVPGTCAVPARKLYDICRALPEHTPIEFHKDGEKLLLKAAKSRFTLHVLPADQFPYLSTHSSRCQGNCNAKAFREALAVTANTMAQNDARLFLNGVLIEVEGQELRLVATDGHRLAMMTLPFANNLESGSYQAILPRKAVLELLRILDDGDIALEMSDTGFLLNDGTQQFACKLIDAKYPDYRRVIPQGHPRFAILDRQTFKSALQQCDVLVSDRNPTTHLHLSNNQMTLRSCNEEQEEGEIQIPVEYQNDTLDIAFNSRYLTDTTQIFAQERLRMRVKDSDSSAVFTPIDGDNPLYIIMPVRL